jgi:hypothetical protein
MTILIAQPVWAGSTTVGDFLKDVATHLRLPAGDALIAEASLRAAGFALPSFDRSAELTEGAVAAISTAMGLHITTSNPAAAFGKEQLHRFMPYMSSQLRSSVSSGPVVQGAARRESSRGRSDSDSRSGSGSGKGKKRPHSRSPKKPHKPKKPRNSGDRR